MRPFFGQREGRRGGGAAGAGGGRRGGRGPGRPPPPRPTAVWPAPRPPPPAPRRAQARRRLFAAAPRPPGPAPPQGLFSAPWRPPAAPALGQGFHPYHRSLCRPAPRPRCRLGCGPLGRRRSACQGTERPWGRGHLGAMWGLWGGRGEVRYTGEMVRYGAIWASQGPPWGRAAQPSEGRAGS